MAGSTIGHRKGFLVRLTCVSIGVAVVSIAGAWLLAQQMPRAQRDYSGLGDSPIAVRVRGLAYVGTDEWKSQTLTSWIAGQCEINDAQSASACAERLGLRCTRAHAPSAACTYNGVLRTRWMNSDHPKNEQWWRADILVTFSYNPSAGLVVRHETNARFEDVMPP